MAVNLSLFAGAGWQFFTDNGIPLSGGLLYTYTAGSTTPETTYADNGGATQNANPIVLDAAGRPPSEIWLSANTSYKFVVKTSTGTLIRTYDDIPGANDVSYILDELANTSNIAQGDALVGFKQANANGALIGAVGKTVHDKLTEFISVKDFGATGDGVTDDTAAIQAALNNKGNIFIPTGVYKITSSLIFKDNTNVEFSMNSRFIAGANNITFFLSSTITYFSQIKNANLNGNGFTGVTGFDLTNFRLQAGLFDCFCADMEYGIVFRYGCFDTPIVNFTSFNKLPYPIIIMDNCGGVYISNARLDNTGNVSGTSVAIDIQFGATIGANIGCVIEGGYSQGFAYGVQDKGFATKINYMYFELCSIADIFFNGTRNSVVSGTNHFANFGPVAIKAVNSDAVSIFYPMMGSGNRTTGLFDFDATNTNCAYYVPGSISFVNTPIGITTGLSIIPIQSTGTFTPILTGSTVAGTGTYSNQSGTWTKTGNIIFFSLGLTWTAHTGSGVMQITGLPNTLLPTSLSYTSSFQCIPGFAFTGPVIYCYLVTGTTGLGVAQRSTTGAVTFVPFAAAGSISIVGSYKV